MDLKKPLDFEEQIKRLKDHGMIIEDEENVIFIIKKDITK